MKVNDIDYYEYQKLVQKASSVDDILNDENKFFKVTNYGGHLYIRADQVDLIYEFKRVFDTLYGEQDRVKQLENAIQKWADQNKSTIGEFIQKYK